jgi:hypothetical protein
MDAVRVEVLVMTQVHGGKDLQDEGITPLMLVGNRSQPDLVEALPHRR